MSEKKRSDFLFGKSEWLFSLNKMTGKKVVDIIGYPTVPFQGSDEPVFKVSAVVFDDGTQLTLEGEHDVPYIPHQEDTENLNEETLRSLF